MNKTSHLLAGFSNNSVLKTMIARYKHLCTNNHCLPCSRLQCIDIFIIFKIILFGIILSSMPIQFRGRF